MSRTHSSGTTLVIGATGKTGRRVVNRFQKRGLSVRSGSRSSQPRFDWNHRETWKEAVQVVESAYITYHADLAFHGAAETVRDFANLAHAQGVRRLVLLSGRNEEGALRGEQYVRDSGADWTIVRSSFFFQNFSESEYFLEPLRAGEFVFPSGNVREPFVDAEDVADVVEAALTDPKHVGEVYEVTGPGLLTFSEVVTAIAAASGRPIRYLDISAEQYQAGMLAQGVPPEVAAELKDLFSTVLDGRNAFVSNGVERALGRSPRDLKDYLAATSGNVWATSAVA